METSLRARLGIPAAFVAVGIPVVLAIFEVQEWKMPAFLAAIFLIILFAIVIVALVVILFELLKEARQFLEHRATTASWVSLEAPGLLDYEADGARASERYMKELLNLTKAIQKLGVNLPKHTKRIQEAGQRGKAESKQKAANEAARDIDRNAVYIEKRADLFEALVKDIARNYQGIISVSSFDTEDDRNAARQLMDTLRVNDGATNQGITGTLSFRNSVKSIEQQNLSRTIRIATKRLGDGLDQTVANLRQFQSQSQRLLELLEKKLP